MSLDGAILPCSNHNLVNLLISKGVPIDPKEGTHHLTPLTIACYRRDIETMQVLKDAGADITQVPRHALNCTYDNAAAICQDIAKAFLLDKQKFENNTKAANELFDAWVQQNI